MRKLLVKLVAIETALVGWLSYWLFSVYASNPPVAAELSSSLQRFPQLSFSTIDIAVLVIIAAFAVTLAFKFQRGLRPGIRLERALQMLENLMKRNLVLEAQVAELKIEKSHTPPVITGPTTSAPVTEPRPGSWEKAFRTPLEAGPPLSTRVAGPSSENVPFGRETGIPPPRIETKPQPTQSTIKPQIVISEKGSETTGITPAMMPDKTAEKPSFASPPKPPSSNWEDSPQFISESKGILTPSASARRVPVVSDSGGLKQPYIPAPAPKVTPSSVIVGPMTSQSPPKMSQSLQPAKITARPGLRPPGSRATSPKSSVAIASPIPPSIEAPKPDADIPPAILPSPHTSFPNKPFPTDETPTTSDSGPRPGDEAGKKDEHDVTKPSQPTRKKLPLEEDETRSKTDVF
jgi:hypothetical protein